MAEPAWSRWLTSYLPAKILDKIEPENIGSSGPLTGERVIPRLFKPDAPGFIEDPYPVFDYLREFEPLHRADMGAWVLTRHGDIVNALIDPRLGNSPSEHAAVHARNRERYVCADVANHILPFIDAPAHTRPRAIIMRRFRRHLKNRPLPYVELAQQQLQALSDRRSFDWLSDFATPLACRVFCRILQLPEQDHQKLLAWGEHVLYLFTVLPSDEVRRSIDQSLTDFRLYLGEHCQGTGNLLYEALLQPDDEGEALDEQQVIDNLMLIFADGIGNTDKAMATAISCLKRHPDQLQLLLDQPGLLPGAVDECLRYESPAQYIGRVALEDMSLYGQTIKKNETVLLVLASANRDPRVFDKPECFDISRYPNPHISFGKSRHSCIGAPLVKQEMAEVLGELLPMLSRIEINFEQLEWDYRPGHRWLKSCPMHRGIVD